ncbi:signal peptidase I [Leifsonia sp. ZF2019]|uniref:signal peptidase I n=1 Tax=Leifsonia sp. ZF2019 TaxID=2781978 RepID=UPI001CC042CC|nr:signal peptidase I [Leifsonia sp. ZF2019]UAJ80101.1 signal peptidase I [Leifsonia sp. ZF2019]
MTRAEPLTLESMSRGWKGIVRDVLVTLVAAVLVSFLIKTFIVRSFYIPSASMENTLERNDRVVVNELQPTVFPVSRGDVVVFKDPGGWLSGSAHSQQPLTPAEAILSFVGIPSAKEDGHLIKRIIGMPGDKVMCCNTLGQITVNGYAIDETPYLFAPRRPASAIPFSVTVPAHSYWVMGDNRDNSGDSRYHQNDPGRGFVPQAAIVGRAFVITWPPSRWSWLDDYPTVFAKQ